MKRLLILVLMVLVSCGLFAQARPSFDQIASGTGKFSDGTAAAPSITFNGDPDTGLYRYGANSIGFGVGGTHALIVGQSALTFTRNSSANGGYVNIGALDGAGAVTAYVQIQGGIATNTAGAFGGNMIFSTTKSGAMSEAARITTDKNLLIGTTTDDGANKLQVNGGLAIAGTAPASAGASGVVGSVRYDSSYIYICVAANTWKRVAISTW